MSLQTHGCAEKDIVDPESQHTDTEEGESLSPRRVQLELRPGRAHTFQVHVKPQRKQKAVDVYFLTSLSANNRGKGHRAKLLAEKALTGIAKSNPELEVHTLGYGLFGHTNVTDKEQKQCEEAGEVCEPELYVTHSSAAPLDLSHWHRPWRTEGGLQALMQVALCKDVVNWGQNDRIVIYATDGTYQVAPEAESVNSSMCQMNNSRIQTKISLPSVSELRKVLLENNIQVIFAVPFDYLHEYGSLQMKLPRARVVYVDVSDPSDYNFEEPFDRVRTSLVLTHSPVQGLNITYRPLCEYSFGGDHQGTCYTRGRHKQKTQTFNVTVSSESCVLPASFEIKSLTHQESLTVELTPRCSCECGDEPDPELCNYAGNPVCGKCRCDAGYFGSWCECSVSDDDGPCRQGRGAPVCLGRGVCVCGQCECHSSLGGRYYGRYCQCDDFSCDMLEGKICGGHGRCKCGKCVCEEGYVGDACDCSTEVDRCQSPDGSLCSGHGQCKCNKCECQDVYAGALCEDCPVC
ncbi:hypothetical protein ACEWY4_023390 [Coilia grayii]|uniref:Integrin beta n=1 Tax=Coilia grayii TaxID=363190 RepID=A0ABD1J350_9TELE